MDIPLGLGEDLIRFSDFALIFNVTAEQSRLSLRTPIFSENIAS